MNITHVKLPEGFIENAGDLLGFLLETQRNHAEKYLEIERANGYIRPESYPIDINARHDQELVKSLAFRAIEELCEATNTLKIRPHSQTEYLTDEEHFLEEMVDFLHYVLELFVVLGLSKEDLVKLYFKKSEVNKFRRETNY